jgi:protease IV
VRKRTALIVAAAVAAVAVGAAAVGAVALLLRGGVRGPAGWVGERAYLALDLSGPLAEEPSSAFSDLFESRAPSLRALVESVDRAAADSRVKGLLLRVGALDVGWARVEELRDALVRFRRTGKPSWAHLEVGGNEEYFLATGCAKIAASPTAILDISGLAAEVTFFRGTLDKLGVQAQFEGIGRYKNAPNQFTKKGFTPPHREQMESLVDSLFTQYVSGVAESRGKGEDEVRALIDEGPFDAATAQARGLVDELLYRDEVEAKLGSSEPVGAARYVRAARGFGFDRRPRMALVYAIGEILPGESASSPLGGSDYAGADTITRGLRQATGDARVRAIILRIDSPGGSGTAADAVWREVERAREVKPVIVSMGDAAASGGYYIAMNGDVIVAEPATITGSIGVFSGKFSLRGLYEKVGLTQETVRRGRHATLFSRYSPWTDEERQKVRELNASFYETFVTKAAEGRNKSPEEIEAVAQGRVWTGAQALQKGLVDRLGGLNTAIDVAREKAGLRPGTDVRLVVMPEKKGLIDLLLERHEEDVMVRVLGREGSAAVRWAATLAEPGPLARLPFDLRVR